MNGSPAASAPPNTKTPTLSADAATLTIWITLVGLCFAMPFLNADSDIDDAFTRNTARLTVAFYGLAVVLMTQMHGDAWRGSAGLGRRARWYWTLGAATFYVHVATAYHFIHHWSQEHAVQHTREVSGVGEGVYVSHLFGVMWLLDAAWWQLRPDAYRTRSRWIGGLLHAFMAFIVFNGTVVYEQGPIRWAGVLLFMLLAALLIRHWMRPVYRPPEVR